MGQATFYYKNANAPEPNKPNHIGATILIKYDGKVLLESRKDSDRWAFIGGGLYLNETLLECVKRETFEETGIILSDGDIEFCKLYDDPSIIIAYPDGNIIRSMMALYTTTLKEMPDLKCSEESVELRFFSKEELNNIKIVETHTPIIEDYFQCDPLEEISFPEHEYESIQNCLNRLGYCYTTRVYKEIRKYKAGKLYIAPWGDVLKIDEVKTYWKVSDRPFYDEMNDEEKIEICKYSEDIGLPYEFIKFSKWTV